MGSELKLRESGAHLKKDEPLFLHEMQEMNNESHPVAGAAGEDFDSKCQCFDLGKHDSEYGCTFPWGCDSINWRVCIQD